MSVKIYNPPMPKFSFTLTNFAAPIGYRYVEYGEIIKEGDMFYQSQFPTPFIRTTTAGIGSINQNKPFGTRDGIIRKL